MEMGGRVGETITFISNFGEMFRSVSTILPKTRFIVVLSYFEQLSTEYYSLEPTNPLPVDVLSPERFTDKGGFIINIVLL